LAGAVLWLPFQRKRTPFVAWKTSHKKKTRKSLLATKLFGTEVFVRLIFIYEAIAVDGGKQ